MNELPVVRRAGGCAAWVAIEPELGVVVRLALSWLPRNCALNDTGTVGLSLTLQVNILSPVVASIMLMRLLSHWQNYLSK